MSLSDAALLATIVAAGAAVISAIATVIGLLRRRRAD